MRVGLVLPVALVMASTSWGVNYIDYDGVEKSKDCTPVTTSNSEDLGSGCYVIQGKFSLPSGKRLESSGDIELVLADGAELTVNYSGDDAFAVGVKTFSIANAMKNLTIYGQKEQTGKLILNATGGGGTGQTGRGIHAKNITINGGSITVTSEISDAICASGDVSIYGGSISATAASSSKKGIKAGCYTGATGNITITWADTLDVSSYNAHNGSVKVSDGITFYDAAGKTYSTVADGVKLMPDYLVVFISYTNGSTRALINGEYKGERKVNFPDAESVDVVDFNRDFTAGVPGTVVLPFSVPAGTTTNAEFYSLESVSPRLKGNNCAWKATMRSIGEGVLPTRNKPYAVILQQSGTRLTFKMPQNGKAEFLTQADITTTTSDQKWHFIGTYSFKEWDEENEDVGLGLVYGFAGSNEDQIVKGKFGKVAFDASDPAKVPYANPLRAYLRKHDETVQLSCPVSNGRPLARGESAIVSEIPETIDVEFIDEDENGEHTTFVGRMNTRTGEFQMKRDYDLKGRKLNGAPTARGAYYGKKVIKK